MAQLQSVSHFHSLTEFFQLARSLVVQSLTALQQEEHGIDGPEIQLEYELDDD